MARSRLHFRPDVVWPPGESLPGSVLRQGLRAVNERSLDVGGRFVVWSRRGGKGGGSRNRGGQGRAGAVIRATKCDVIGMDHRAAGATDANRHELRGRSGPTAALRLRVVLG